MNVNSHKLQQWCKSFRLSYAQNRESVEDGTELWVTTVFAYNENGSVREAWTSQPDGDRNKTMNKACEEIADILMIPSPKSIEIQNTEARKHNGNS